MYIIIIISSPEYIKQNLLVHLHELSDLMIVNLNGSRSRENYILKLQNLGDGRQYNSFRKKLNILAWEDFIIRLVLASVHFHSISSICMNLFQL